ncbi:MAG TPA: NAD(P)H-binding protein [Propioniciclava tarda]|nr:NAD(P)H-binding protein [Propioniciclava tarda]HQA30127.1 NAD(P)H-binding protein [Propioniciclava tarda]HQD60522.1 NAD(P)H-binding protein [Propioniciclava tarda]
MKIGIIGGSGKAGRALFSEAVKRGDVPTAIVRDLDTAEGVLGEFGNYLNKDALKLTASDLASFDVVIDAMGTAPDDAARQVTLTKHLVELVRAHGGPRLVFVLGAGSLTTPDGRLYLDELYEIPGTASWIAIPEQQTRQLTYLRSVDDVDWTAVSPSAEFRPGPAGTPVLGKDDLLYGPNGTSKVTSGTLAVAVLDEIHNPAHVRTRFTVRDENC